MAAASIPATRGRMHWPAVPAAAAPARALAAPAAAAPAPLAAAPSVRRSVSRRPVTAASRGSGGGAGLLERPGFETAGPGSGPAVDERGSKLDRGRGSGLGGGSWRVLLLDSEKHTEERVVAAITAVVPGADQSHAANCFHTARSLGQAIVTCMTHAEIFCQMLWQRGLKIDMEPDTTTL